MVLCMYRHFFFKISLFYNIDCAIKLLHCWLLGMRIELDRVLIVMLRLVMAGICPSRHLDSGKTATFYM